MLSAADARGPVLGSHRARAVPVPDQGAGPGPGARAAPLRARTRRSGRRSTTATRRAPSAPRSASAATSILTNPDMLHVGILPHHDAWDELLSNLAFVVIDEAHVYRGVFGSHVGNVLRRLRRVAAIHGTEPRFLLASATIANPVELAEALTGLEDFNLVDRDTAPKATRRVAMWNPPLLDEQLGVRGVGSLRGGRGVLGAGRQRRADDLLHEVAQGGRADPPPRGRPARPRAGRADRALPRRLHAGPAPRDRAPPDRGRAARRGRHRRARARDRHRRARRRRLRHLSRDRRQPAADVGAGRPPGPRAGGLHRRRGRARPVLLPPSGRVPRPPGRGGDPRPRQQRDLRRASALRRPRGAAQRRRRADPRTAVARARQGAGRRRAAARARDRLRAPAGPTTIRPRAWRCARRRPTASS